MTKIANSKTKVPVARTVAEITEMLVAQGARTVNIEYENLNAKAVRFEIVRPEYSMTFALPADARATCAALNRERRRGCAVDIDQARRVAWRVVRDWLRAQLTLVEIGAAKLEQVMLPYAIVDDEGTTLYARLVDKKFAGLALPSAEGAL